MNAQLKIVHTTCHNQWGGLERRIYSEDRWMSSRGHRLFIIAPPASRLMDRSTEAGWKTAGVDFSKWAMLTDSLRVRGMLRAFRPHILNTHGNTDTKVALTAACGWTILCVLLSRHVSSPVNPSWYNRMLYGKLCHHIMTISAVAADAIVARLGVPESRVVTASTGISLPHDMPRRTDAVRRLRSELGLPGTISFLGYVGRLDRAKGLLDFLSTFSMVVETGSRHHLVVVGEGADRQAIASAAEALNIADKVQLTGYRENPWPYYRGMDCVVLPSTENEGIPQKWQKRDNRQLSM